MMAWVGMAGFLDFWGAIDPQTGALLGITGLYQGIGSRLLDFSIEQAKRTGRKYLRLYTSDMSNEAAAQILYESRGLEIVARKWRLFYTVIYRELRLDPPA